MKTLPILATLALAAVITGCKTQGLTQSDLSSINQQFVDVNTRIDSLEYQLNRQQVRIVDDNGIYRITFPTAQGQVMRSLNLVPVESKE